MRSLCGVFDSCFGRSGDEDETELQPTAQSGPTTADQFEATAHQPAPTPPPPPRLDTSQPHPRVWQGMPDPDPDTPPTPTPSVMARYSDPNNLPGPTGARQEGGYGWVSYGRNSVHAEYSPEHQRARRHEAATPQGRKNLAVREQGPGHPIYTTPYEAYGDRPRVTSLGGLPLDKEPRSLGPRDLGEPRVIQKYPVDQGLVSHRGGSFSAATVAVHEGWHAQRLSNPAYSTRTLTAGTWRDLQEQLDINKAENPTAIAHGETPRDSHHLAGQFKSTGLTSTEPHHPEAKTMIEQAKPILRRDTDVLDRHNVDPAQPFRQGPEADYAMSHREAIGQMLSEDLDHLHRGKAREGAIQDVSGGTDPAQAVRRHGIENHEDIRAILQHGVERDVGNGVPRADANQKSAQSFEDLTGWEDNGGVRAPSL